MKLFIHSSLRWVYTSLKSLVAAYISTRPNNKCQSNTLTNPDCEINNTHAKESMKHVIGFSKIIVLFRINRVIDQVKKICYKQKKYKKNKINTFKSNLISKVCF